MAVGIDKGDLPKIAKNYGQAGRPMPDWVRNDPALIAAYDQGTGASHPLGVSATTTSSATPSTPAAASPAAGSSSKKPRKKGYAARGFSPSAAVGRTPVGKLISAGDGGGLMLAFVLYPIALSVLKYGSAGPGLWFRAKWLNETTKEPNNLGAVANSTAPGAAGGNPANNVPGMPGYHTSGAYDPNAKPGPVARNPDGTVKLGPTASV